MQRVFCTRAESKALVALIVPIQIPKTPFLKDFGMSSQAL